MHLSIAIDCSHYEVAQPTGVERYVDAMIPRLVKILKAAGVTVYLLDHRRESATKKIAGGAFVYLGYKKSWLTRVVRPWVEESGVSLLFTPSGTAPVFGKKSPIKTAFTIHDLSIYDSKRSYKTTDWIRFFLRQPAAARRASALFVPSAYVASQVERRLKIGPRHIAVTPLALPEGAHTSAKTSTEKYVLYVGRIEKKKNLVPLVRAMKYFPEYSLILVGSLGYGGSQHLKQLKRIARKQLVYKGFVSDRDRIDLLAGAQALAVPSPLEGFGIPVLEGFAAEIPVLAAKAGAVAEVAGDAAILVSEPLQVRSWQIALDKLEKLSREDRHHLVKSGQSRLKLFTWDNTAQLTADKLLKILKA